MLFRSTVNEYKDILDKRMLWDLFKIKLKELSSAYCKLRSKSKKTEVAIINDRFEQIEKDINSGNNTDKIKTERAELKEKIDNISKEQARSYFVRSRAEWMDKGEKYSKYFAGLENSRQSNNSISKLTTSCGNNATGDSSILKEMVHFYKKLYTSSNPTTHQIESYLNKINIQRSLNAEEQNSCEGMVTCAECWDVVKSLKHNKSPGIDGLPGEFYKVFFPLVGEFLEDVYNESISKGELCESQKRSVLSLIFKKGDRCLLKNYRPISLSTTDYKILAHILASRIKPILPNIINESQTGYVQGRSICQNIRLVQDVIAYAKSVNQTGLLLFLDFEKAFDSIEWQFIWRTLNKYKFGPTFITCVKTLYVDSKIICKNNHWLSEEFSLSRGIRQGCPISALLFIIATDVLAEHIKQELRGLSISMNGKMKRIKLAQYADDTILFLRNTDEVLLVTKLLKEFKSVAGLNLNLDKTEALYIADDSENVSSIHGIACNINGAIRCLGVHVGHNQALCDTLNWEKKILEIEKLFIAWKKRDLTLFGKITVIKMLAIPKLILIAQTTAHKKNIYRSTEKTVFYIYMGKARSH